MKIIVYSPAVVLLLYACACVATTTRLVLGEYHHCRWRRSSYYFNRWLLSFGRCCKIHFRTRLFLETCRRKVSPLQCGLLSMSAYTAVDCWKLASSHCFEHEYQISQSIMAKAHAINNVSSTIDFTNPDTRCAYQTHSVCGTFKRFTIKFPF